MRVYAKPVTAEKLRVTLGIAPISYEELKRTTIFEDAGYPQIDPLDVKDPNDHHGIDTRKLEQTAENCTPNH